MGDVDAILRSGEYTDRRGQFWYWDDVHMDWVRASLTGALCNITPDEMRLLIVRDLHRAECPGLRECENHPVPHVVQWVCCGPTAYAAGDSDREEMRTTFAEAIAAAHNMTGEKR